MLEYFGKFSEERMTILSWTLLRWPCILSMASDYLCLIQGVQKLQILLVGKLVEAEVYQVDGKVNQAVITCDGVDINQEMLNAGFGERRLYRRPDSGDSSQGGGGKGRGQGHCDQYSGVGASSNREFGSHLPHSSGCPQGQSDRQDSEHHQPQNQSHCQGGSKELGAYPIQTSTYPQGQRQPRWNQYVLGPGHTDPGAYTAKTSAGYPSPQTSAFITNSQNSQPGIDKNINNLLK